MKKTTIIIRGFFIQQSVTTDLRILANSDLERARSVPLTVLMNQWTAAAETCCAAFLRCFVDGYGIQYSQATVNNTIA